MTCNHVLQAKGLPNPRTCADCGLGPCRQKMATALEGLGMHEIELIIEVRIKELADSLNEPRVNGANRVRLAQSSLNRAVDALIARMDDL